MRLRITLLASVFVVVGAACVAEAAFTSLNPTLVPQDVLPNVVVTDLLADFTGQNTGQQMLLTLTAGTVFQHGSGNTAPDQEFIDVFPQRAYDTFVTANGNTVQTSSVPLIPGGAEHFGAPALKMDTEGLSVAWGTSDVFADRTGFMTARVSLSNDAVGALQYVGFTGSGASLEVTEYQFSIMNGVIGEGDPGNLPVVNDLVLDPIDVIGGTSMGTVTGTDVDTWSDVVTRPAVDAYVPGFGAGPAATDISAAPTFDPVSQTFSWDSTGAYPGTYRWLVSGSNAEGSDTGLIEVALRIPEPTTLSLFGLALVGCIGAIRRRS